MTITLKALLGSVTRYARDVCPVQCPRLVRIQGTGSVPEFLQEWLTLYHSTPKNPESQSHLHLKWHTFQRAVVTHEAGKTPVWRFMALPRRRRSAAHLVFPQLLQLGQGQAEIPENIAQYETFVTGYGTTLKLVAPSATE